jgi:hypothetical protein
VASTPQAVPVDAEQGNQPDARPFSVGLPSTTTPHAAQRQVTFLEDALPQWRDLPFFDCVISRAVIHAQLVLEFGRTAAVSPYSPAF